MWTHSKKKAMRDPHEEQAMHRQIEDRAAEVRRRHVHSRNVDLGADESHESRKLCGFCPAEVSLHSEDLGSPCADLGDEQVAGRGCKDILSHDEDIPTLNVAGEALEEEMEREIETVQDAERVRTISNPGQPSKRSTRQHVRSAEAGVLHVNTLSKAVVDFMSGYGRAMRRLLFRKWCNIQDRVIQFLKSREHIEGSRRNDTHVEDVCRGQVEGCN